MRRAMKINILLDLELLKFLFGAAVNINCKNGVLR
jgi:hypothetical protein